MEKKLQKSIDRAISLLKTPKEYEKYISIKISSPSGCCCSHCWPETCQKINQAIAPCGPIVHEGYALIGKDGNKFVLESHESGPEIIAYLPLATQLIGLSAAIITLVTLIIKARSDENQNRPSHIRLQKKQIIKEKLRKKI